ncbi:hypothetical protein J437_LFUL016901 [Ladona fulva]|uniref:Uncharacterized protein n=1 Tax=Ladona fulva TaxID=123851 RepID=A0A8K0KR60_LADFU|nr:hypothetical protein J437_LFUL016901 [Ladona fulva]
MRSSVWGGPWTCLHVLSVSGGWAVPHHPPSSLWGRESRGRRPDVCTTCALANRTNSTARVTMGVLVNEDPWIPPPPKKKWIRHYLSGEIPKDFGAFTSASPPPAPTTPPTSPILREDAAAGSSQTAAAQELRRRVGCVCKRFLNPASKVDSIHFIV